MANLSIIDGNYRDGGKAVSRSNDNIQTRASIDTNGIYTPTMDIGNDFNLSVTMGDVTGLTSVHKFGANDSIATVEEDLWINGGIYPWPTTAEPVRIKSGGNSNDTAAGTGAQKITITGLNENWTEVTEDLVTAGISASSASDTTFRRINTMYVKEAGTYGGCNTGAIVLENTSSTQVLANISALRGASQLSMYTVPAGKTGYVQSMTVGVAGKKEGTMYVYLREGADDVTGSTYTSKRILRASYGLSGQATSVERSQWVLPEKSDFWLSGIAPTAAAFGCQYDLILVDN